MSKNQEMTGGGGDPAAGGPAASLPAPRQAQGNGPGTTGKAGPGGGAGKALRVEQGKAEPDGGVFRLDSLGAGDAVGGVGVGGGLAAPKGSKVSHAAIFFAVLIVVGGGLLFAMRRIGINPMSAIAKMKEPEIDLTKNAKSSVDHKRVLRDLSESAVKGQVPLEQVQKNPFEIPEVIAAPTSEDPEVAAKQAALRAQKEAEERKKRLDSVLAGLRVHGILGGSTPVARINDKAVRVGDRVEEIFEVVSIQGRSVELECDGALFVLSLDDEPGKSPVRKPGKKK